jgi:hypothetical protein
LNSKNKPARPFSLDLVKVSFSHHIWSLIAKLCSSRGGGRVKAEAQASNARKRVHIWSILEIQCRNDRGGGAIGGFSVQQHVEKTYQNEALKQQKLASFNHTQPPPKESFRDKPNCA